ncbi:hypothetical protein LTR27_008638 [Elasticomyces elasticus]|nr:hypothetical protein LTR27_008638 [Elasticomyces elasticus]
MSTGLFLAKLERVFARLDEYESKALFDKNTTSDVAHPFPPTQQNRRTYSVPEIAQAAQTLEYEPSTKYDWMPVQRQLVSPSSRKWAI